MNRNRIDYTSLVYAAIEKIPESLDWKPLFGQNPT